jgi:uncharacterized protein YcbX
MSDLGTVGQLWRYPVKSMQGAQAGEVEVAPTGVVGDRQWALIDEATGRVLSAKRSAALLGAVGTDGQATLPDGSTVALDASGAGAALSAWLGQEVTVRTAAAAESLSYQMTFEPTNDDAEYYDIPIKNGTFLDLAPIHLVTTATLDACAAARPDLDWDVRRFRPNVVLDVDGPAFQENDWTGKDLRIGDVVLQADGPTVRCAMPLRAQPGLERQPALFKAMEELNPAMPNHLGAYLSVVEPGIVRVGDVAALV